MAEATKKKARGDKHRQAAALALALAVASNKQQAGRRAAAFLIF
jgi:hypothetical protein